MSRQSDDGGDEGERGEEGGGQVEEVTGGPSHIEIGHHDRLAWSDLISSHHHQHDATEAIMLLLTTVSR